MKLSVVPLLLLSMIAAREWISCEASRKMPLIAVEEEEANVQTDGFMQLFLRRILSEDEEESNEMETELMLPDDTDGENLDITTDEEGKAVQSEQKEPVQQVSQVEEEQVEALMEEKQEKIEDQKPEKKKKKKKSKEKEQKPTPSGDDDLGLTSVMKGSDKEKSAKKIASKTKKKPDPQEKVLKSEAEDFVEQKISDQKTVEKLQEEGGVIKAKKKVKKDMEEASTEILEDKAVKGEVMAEEAEAFSVEGTLADKTELEMEGGVEDLVSEVVEEENEGDIIEKKLQTKGEKGNDMESTLRKQQGSSEDSKQAKGKNAKEKESKEKKAKEKPKVKAQVLDEEMEAKGFNPNGKESGLSAAKTKQGGEKLSEPVLVSELVERDLDVKVEEKLETEAGKILNLQSEQVETQDTVKPKAKGKKKKDKLPRKAKKEEKLSDMDIQSLDEGTEDGTKSNSLSKPTKGKQGKKAPDVEKSEMVELNMSTETEEIVTKRNQTKVKKPSERTQDEPLKTQKQEETLEVEVEATTKEGKVSTKEGSEEAQQSEIVDELVSSSVLGNDDDDDEYGDFMQDFVDLPSKIQDTAQKVADHLGPNIQKITDTSKVYFNKANQHITDSFSPLVGKQFAPFLASLISYGLLLAPLAIVILLFEHIRALLSIQKILLFVNIYLAAYFATLLLATFIIGEPMTFFYKSSASGYIHLQLLQALGYIIYLVLQTFDLVASCPSESLPVKVTVVLQWLVAFTIGFHYYVTVFHRAMTLKGPHTSWKIYGIYSIAFFILCLFARIKRTKKGYSQLGDADTDKKN